MNLLLISSSTVHGSGFLDRSEMDIQEVLGERRRVAFVPFARHDCAGYAERVRERLGRMGLEVVEVRGRAEIDDAEAIFVGGGNSFRLIARLHQLDLLGAIRARVLDGVPYIGASAGTNVAAPSIKSTNDMPIVYPPSFQALGLVPFQINPHYVDPDPESTHMGETRQERILELLEENETPVIGLREGSALRIRDGRMTLLGNQTARLFRRDEPPEEFVWHESPIASLMAPTPLTAR